MYFLFVRSWFDQKQTASQNLPNSVTSVWVTELNFELSDAPNFGEVIELNFKLIAALNFEVTYDTSAGGAT